MEGEVLLTVKQSKHNTRQDLTQNSNACNTYRMGDQLNEMLLSKRKNKVSKELI